jgi:hypothetical protein
MKGCPGRLTGGSEGLTVSLRGLDAGIREVEWDRIEEGELECGSDGGAVSVCRGGPRGMQGAFPLRTVATQR